MKNLLLSLSILIAGSTLAQVPDTITKESEIKNVTLFFTGAQITRTTEIDLKTGKHMVLLTDLPIEINPNSVQVAGIDDCKILSVKHDIKHKQKDKNDPRIKKFEDDIEIKNKRIDEISDELSVYRLEEQLLMDNRKLGKNNEGSSIAEIKEAADYYRERLLELRKLKQGLMTEYKEIRENILDSYTEINKIFAESSKSYSQISIAIDCETTIDTELTVSYYITSAGWEPTYDFRVDDITKPLNITYKANVYQSSGEDWDNVNITLSTTNPVLTGTAPELKSWYLSYYTNTYDREPISSSKNGSIYGTVYDSDMNEPIPYANIALYKDGAVYNGTITDLDGQYVIKPVQEGYYNLECSYIGYSPANISSLYVSADQRYNQNLYLSPSAIDLAAIEVVSYESEITEVNLACARTISSQDIQYVSERSSYGDVDGAYTITGELSDESYYYQNDKKSLNYKSTNYIANTVKKSVANLEYKIDIPYSIPSDGENYDLKIKDVELDVDYVYHAVPKIEEDAFLSAQIIDWTELDLLSGETSIYYNGTFTGESYIDVNTASDTLDISLGRDKSIIIEREGNKEINDAKIIGNNVKETIGWNITVKNNKDVKIKIILEDQFPMSTRKSVEVEQLEWTNGLVDSKDGTIKWELEIEPKKTSVVKTSYSVKYSKYDDIKVE